MEIILRKAKETGYKDGESSDKSELLQYWGGSGEVAEKPED